MIQLKGCFLEIQPRVFRTGDLGEGVGRVASQTAG